MKSLKISFIVALLATAFVGCNTGSEITGSCADCPTDPVPDSVDIRIEVLDFDTDERITTAEIFLDSTKVKSDNGLYTDRREEENVDIGVYAEAADYESMIEEQVINLSSDVNLAIRLKKKEQPDPEGPGKITLVEKHCSDPEKSNGWFIVKSENGADLISVGDDKRTDVEAGEEETFEGLSAGHYEVIFTKNDKAEKLTVTLSQCEVANKPPEADFTISTNGLEAHFDNESSDPDGDDLSYLWTFSDGSTSKKENPSFKHQKPGQYEVKLKATDEHGASDTKTKSYSVKAKDFGSITKEESCSDYDGHVQFQIENGITGYRLENTDTDNIVSEDYGLDPKISKTLKFKDLPDGSYRVYLRRYNHKTNRKFTVNCDQNLSDEYAHEVNYDLKGEGNAVSKSNEKESLISHGELRPILTEEDPVGTVRMEIDYHLDKDESGEDFSLLFRCGDKKSEFFTPTVKDRKNIDGWTTSEIILDANNFKSREFCSITAVSEGDGEVIFSTEDTAGKMIFYWKIEVDGKTKVFTTTFQTNIN